jgi:protein-L-isoaspartate(D-aspartate) O-methyltransferase
MVAIMNEALELRNGMRVLEVGGGSGYHAATIAEIVGDEGHVFAIEYVDKLVSIARNNLKRAGYTNRVTLVQGDGSLGYAERAPYDRILVTATAPRIPPSLLEQLKPDGILVLPVGGRMFPQELVRVRKKPDGTLDRNSLGGVAFVPLIGKQGFNGLAPEE